MKTFLMMLFLLVPVFAFGQDGTEPGGGLVEYVLSFTAFVSTVLLITSFLNEFFFKWGGSAKQYLSWAIALLVGVAAYFLNLGIFDAEWYYTLVYTAFFALGANGLFDWELIRKILQAIGLEPKE